MQKLSWKQVWLGWGQEESHLSEGKRVGSKTREVGEEGDTVKSRDYILITYNEKSSGVLEMGVGGVYYRNL